VNLTPSIVAIKNSLESVRCTDQLLLSSQKKADTGLKAKTLPKTDYWKTDIFYNLTH